MDLISTVLQMLKDQAFSNIEAIEGQGQQVFPVTDLRSISSYQIVRLDATAAEEFQDEIYVAIENNTNSLLEIAKVSSSPRLIDDAEAQKIVSASFPQFTFKIVLGYFWEPCIELTSRISVARRFTINGKEKFLLPNGQATDQLHKLGA